MSGGGEALAVSDRQIADAFHHRFGETLTAAELRLIKHLLSGEALGDVTESDPAYHTRRKQLGVLRHKTGLSRQSQIVQATTTAILMRLFEHNSVAAQFASLATAPR